MRFSPARVAAVGVALFAVSPTDALAYRPFDSTDADVAKTGEVELEIGPIGYLQEDTHRFLVVPALIANAGIFHRWELVLEGRHLVRTEATPGEPREELADSALSLKTVLREGVLQDRPGLSVATELGALLPATTEETGFGVTAALIVSAKSALGAAHLNGGAFVSRTHEPGVFTALILEGPLEWKVRPVMEGFLEKEREGTTVATGLAGFIWRVNDGLSFDAAIRVGRAFDTRLVEVRAGLTWAFAP